MVRADPADALCDRSQDGGSGPRRAPGHDPPAQRTTLAAPAGGPLHHPPGHRTTLAAAAGGPLHDPPAHRTTLAAAAGGALHDRPREEAPPIRRPIVTAAAPPAAAAPLRPAAHHSRRPRRSRCTTSHPRSRAIRRSVASGLTTTGWPTHCSIGRSDSESE